jgi:pSer/pThr/pTyr-binding forkhead associated (FHA) protein
VAGASWIIQSKDETPIIYRLHCRLTADKSDQLIVEDLDSTNGTSVNGARVTRHVLKAGDLLKVGRVEFDVKQT